MDVLVHGCAGGALVAASGMRATISLDSTGMVRKNGSMAGMAGAGGSYARCHERVGQKDTMQAERRVRWIPRADQPKDGVPHYARASRQ